IGTSALPPKADICDATRMSAMGQKRTFGYASARHASQGGLSRPPVGSPSSFKSLSYCDLPLPPVQLLERERIRDRSFAYSGVRVFTVRRFLIDRLTDPKCCLTIPRQRDCRLNATD